MHPHVDASPPSRIPGWIRLVGPAVAIALLWQIDLREVWASLAEARWQPIALSLFLVAPLLLAKAWRWRLLLGACGRRISLGEALWLYTIATGAASLTPGAVGDFWKGLSPVVGSKSVGLWTSAIDRLYDLALLGLLGLVVSVAWLHGRASKAIGASLLVVAVLALWRVRWRVLDLATSLLPRFPRAASALLPIRSSRRQRDDLGDDRRAGSLPAPRRRSRPAAALAAVARRVRSDFGRRCAATVGRRSRDARRRAARLSACLRHLFGRHDRAIVALPPAVRLEWRRRRWRVAAAAAAPRDRLAEDPTLRRLLAGRDRSL